MGHRYKPVNNWGDFEELMLDIYKLEWNDKNAQLNGRGGQVQCGVDVFSSISGLNSGVQCKKKDEYLAGSTLTLKEIDEEVNKALNFIPKLNSFYISYTGSRDVKLQEKARIITEDHRKKKLFSVHILSWEEIESLIKKHSEIIHPKYFSEFMIETISTSTSKSNEKQIIEGIFDEIEKNGIVEITNAMTGNGMNSTIFGTTEERFKVFKEFFQWFDKNKSGRSDFETIGLYDVYNQFYKAYKELVEYSVCSYKPVAKKQGEVHLGYEVNPKFNPVCPDAYIYGERVKKAEELGGNFDESLKELELFYTKI
ncbi:hypothetical protein [Viridibacillus arvi]|uniref:hypothetical protein n=1 Tax=Viridibacillus arvi TaxID=263475 RepID=UPI0036E21879